MKIDIPDTMSPHDWLEAFKTLDFMGPSSAYSALIAALHYLTYEKPNECQRCHKRHTIFSQSMHAIMGAFSATLRAEREIMRARDCGTEVYQFDLGRLMRRFESVVEVQASNPDKKEEPKL